MYKNQTTKLIRFLRSLAWLDARIYFFYILGGCGILFAQNNAMAQNNAVIEAEKLINDALSDKISSDRSIMKLQAAVFILERDMKQQSADRATLRAYQKALNILIDLLCKQKRYVESHQYYLTYQKTSPPAQKARKLYLCLKPAISQILGKLTVTSQPAQVTVLIKDSYGKEYTKTTPFSIKLPKGTVQLSAQRPHFSSYEEAFQLEPNTDTKRDIVLHKKQNKIPPAPNKSQVIVWSSVSVAVVGAIAGSLFLVGALQTQVQSSRIKNNTSFLSNLVVATKLSSEDYNKLSLHLATADLEQQFVISLAAGITLLSISAIATSVAIGVFVHHRKKQPASTAADSVLSRDNSVMTKQRAVLFVLE